MNVESIYHENALLFKALSHPVRLHIVDLIRTGNPCVKVLEEELGVAQPNISQHLSLLRNLGIVEAERDGNQVCYKIKNKRVLRLLDVLHSQTKKETHS